MLNFANPYYSYLFFVPILILLLYWWSKISLSNRLKKFGDISLINRLTPETSKYMPNIKIILQVFVLVLII